MTFYAFGLNYEQAPVDTTESFALDEVDQRELYATLDLSDGAEVIFLSTCNRTEVYLYGTQGDVRHIQNVLSAKAGRPWPESESFMFDDEAAVMHVLQVASGIRSMVLGDGQILSQIKEAYRRAVESDAVDTLLHRLMHTAFRAAKRVATETDLSGGAASVSTASVAMALDHFERSGSRDRDDFQGIHVLLVGAGKMGRLALDALDSYAPSSVSVTNRSPDRAAQVAAKHDAETVDWHERYAAIGEADFVIVATGAPEPVVSAPNLPPYADGSKRTLLVDISMPRNIDPAIDARDGYRVLDLDDLRAYTERVQEERGSEVPAAQEICEELMSDFVTWVFHQQALQPAIQAIRNTFDAIREQEVDRHAHRTGMDREEVDRLTKSIMQKLLAVPIVRLKNVDPDSIDFVRGIKLLHALFSRPGCEDESAQKVNRHAQESEQAHRSPSLSDAPGHCPFETHSSNEIDVELRKAIQAPSESSS